jgi:D-aminopeptidase
MIVPNEGRIWSEYAYCGVEILNGNGEMTGIPWVEESGMLGSPIALTNTHQVGMVRDAMVRYASELNLDREFILPVAAETYDGQLNDAESFSLTAADAIAAITGAGPGPVAEGNVGGGTGMICHEFKGGIGTSSRIVDLGPVGATVGVLVQANYGVRRDLRIDGIPVGRQIGFDVVPSAWEGENETGSGSIIVVIATDAPLVADQCRRLAKRATIGLARVGGYGNDSSGDIFIAFSTGNHLPRAAKIHEVRTLDHGVMSTLFRATAEAVEEAILNTLSAAETMSGYRDHIAYELPLDLTQQIIRSKR